MPRPLFVAVLLLGIAPLAGAMDTLTFRYRPYPDADAVTATATGRVLMKDSSGNCFFESVDGARRLIAADDVLSASSDDAPFAPATADELGERLLADLPAGFRLHPTKHYVIAYDTSREYAEWSSSLLEGLQKALVRYWKRAGIELEEPEFPLPIVIHSTAAAYNAASRAEGVPAGAVGYYHMTTNRVRMYDITGAQQLRAGGMRSGSRREITRMLSLPAAEPLVATIVHEATHQVCFNTGLMQRYADLPIWLVEGMAAYFEAPGAGTSRGWSGIGHVNQRRLQSFRRNLPKWNGASLTSLLASDDRLRDSRTAGEAYADAWALNYYLIKKHGDDYVAYVKELSKYKPFDGPPADESDAETSRQRLKVFTEHFGPPAELEQDFLQVMSRL
ncbi:DUF1570 domain-containing protein [Botrimarina mediterranea]|uniref:DUF1570 domain-containing protein n=1 Tax=Botrimarina mediterranea TaxID=2528022 RepID=A0A518K2Z8_9BACT|nr:DUF1570 domain-containing protein [Botrimarina mediterranea]QDV72125.1 hypothetical protein Spa11_02960 [Botrimarina mediterranea]QDV76667.1 hypothetical protein K2D_02470 [Planctomycetes bacterium K2D]